MAPDAVSGGRPAPDELTQFFRRAQEASRRGAEQGKQLLATRITASGKG